MSRECCIGVELPSEALIARGNAGAIDEATEGGMEGAGGSYTREADVGYG